MQEITIDERLDTTVLLATCLLGSIETVDKYSVADHRLIQENLDAIRKHIEKQDAVIVYLANTVESDRGQTTDDIIKEAEAVVTGMDGENNGQ